MPSDFDKFVDKLNKSVIAEMRQNYSEKVVELFLNPINIGKIEKANASGKVKGPCGDTIEIFLQIRNNIIVDAKFTTDGCGPSIVCGVMVTELVKGKDIKECLGITGEKILNELGGLPEADQHCAKLAADTLCNAITKYNEITMDKHSLDESQNQKIV